MPCYVIQYNHISVMDYKLVYLIVYLAASTFKIKNIIVIV